MLVHRSREEEDFTRDKSDFKEATVIAKKVTELRCYRPYVPDGAWALRRQRGARRAEKLVAAGAARQRLLTCSSAPGRRCSPRPPSRWTRRPGWSR